MKHSQLFEPTLQRAYIINTDKGPVIRVWVPMMGWHYAKPLVEGEFIQVGAPCDPTPLQFIIKPI